MNPTGHIFIAFFATVAALKFHQVLPEGESLKSNVGLMLSQVLDNPQDTGSLKRFHDAFTGDQVNVEDVVAELTGNSELQSKALDIVTPMLPELVAAHAMGPAAMLPQMEVYGKIEKALRKMSDEPFGLKNHFSKKEPTDPTKLISSVSTPRGAVKNHEDADETPTYGKLYGKMAKYKAQECLQRMLTNECPGKWNKMFFDSKGNVTVTEYETCFSDECMKKCKFDYCVADCALNQFDKYVCTYEGDAPGIHVTGISN